MILQSEALLFDLDQTLVRSSFAIDSAWAQFAERVHLDFSDIKLLLPGRRDSDIIALTCPDMTPRQVRRELAAVRADEIELAASTEPMPGAAEILSLLDTWQWAVVTAASRSLMEARMCAAGLPVPAVSICGEDVSAGKPDPEGFLEAARQLMVRPDRCIGFEDSAQGFEALDAAGMRIIGVNCSPGRQWKSSIISINNYDELSLQVVKPYIEIDV